MFITLDSPQNAVKMPVQIARSLEQMDYGQGRGEIAPPEFIELINNLADHCELIHKGFIKKMKRVDACRVFKKIKPMIPELLEAEQLFLIKYHQRTYCSSVLAMERLFENVRMIVGEIIYIAEGAKINDAELDAFLLERASRLPSSPSTRITGRSAVLALVD